MYDASLDETGQPMLFSIGYEGTDQASFVQRLRKAGVEILVDIRERPLSRKKGFSKNGLASAVRDEGIEYVHIRALGDPKPGRDAARAGDHERFRQIFSAHMATDEAQNALGEVVDLIDQRSACLLCFEKCHIHCHRSIVAKHLTQLTKRRFNHIAV